MRSFFLLFCFFLTPFLSSLRAGTKDSLLTALKTGREDTSGINLRHRIANSPRSVGFTQAEKEKYAREAIGIASRLNDKRKLAQSYAILGNVFRKGSNTDSASLYFNRALHAYEELGDNGGMSGTFYSISQVEMDHGQFKECLNHLLAALKCAEKNQDKEQMAFTLGAMANLDVTLRNFKKAEGEHAEALKFAIEAKKNSLVAYNLNGLATCYSAMKEYDKAIESYDQSLEIYRELGDDARVASAYNNIGTVYAQQAKYDDALLYFRKGLAAQEKAGNKRGMVMCYTNIGFAENEKGKYKDAVTDFLKALELLKTIDNKYELKETYEGLALAYARMKRFDLAYDYQQKFSQISDTIFNQDMSRSVADMEAKYQAERAQKQIEILHKDAEIQELTLRKSRFWMIALIGAGIIVLLVAILVYRGYLQKKKSSEMLALQNQAISHQKKEITDSISYAQRIQQSILPPEVIWKKSLPNSFVLYKPKDIVSGDFYWIESRDNKVLFAAVDCTGHGVPGALMSVVGFNFLTQAVSERGLTKPSDILQHLDYGVNKMLRQSQEHGSVKDGMDLALCSLEPETGLLHYAGAYNSLYYVSEGKLHEVKADKKPIGSNVDDIADEFTNHEIKLKKGDYVYLFSDGFADQFGGPNGKKFKYKAFQQLILQVWQKDPDTQRDELDKAIEQWRGQLEQVDDILVIGVKI